MKKDIYLGRQLILDKDNNVAAYELLYCDPHEDDFVLSSSRETATIAINLLNQFGKNKIVGNHPAFIKVDSEFLMSEMLASLPKESFILSLDRVNLRARAIERVAQLHAQGYKIAVNDSVLDRAVLEYLKPIAQYVSYYKIDTDLMDIGLLGELIEEGCVGAEKLVAAKVEKRSTYEEYLRAGITLFEGNHFSHPVVLSEKTYSPEKGAVISIWKLLIADTPVEEISQAFERYPTLTLQLLQYINSSAYTFNKKIKSIEQVLVLLGRLPLMQWLLLLIHSKNGTSGGDTPLQMLLINRIELMRGIFQLIKQKVGVTAQEVHLVGLLSLIDVILEMSLADVLREFDVDPGIAAALTDQTGVLGEILGAARAIECFDTQQIEAFLQRYEIPADDIVHLTLESIEKVNQFEALI